MKQLAACVVTFAVCLGAARFAAGQNRPAPAKRPRPHAALGVSLAEAKNGVRVIAVVPGSPAEKAGLLPGDEIRHIGEERVQSIRTFIDKVREFAPGTPIELNISRHGERHVLKAQLASVSEVFGEPAG